LWSFDWDCGRSGSLEGLFVATEEEVNDVIGKYCSFGEVLGKHSDVYGNIEAGDITKMNVSPEAVEEVSKVLGTDWSGFNPLDYAYKQCELVFEGGERCENTFHPEEACSSGGYDNLCYDCCEMMERSQQ
jgi:hypothetical protein